MRILSSLLLPALTNLRFRSVTTLASTPSPLASPAPVPIIFLDMNAVIDYFDKKEWKDTKKLCVDTSTISTFEIYCSKTVVAKINSWVKSQRAEVRWLAHWDEDTQIKLASALGLDHFPMVVGKGPPLYLSRDQEVLATLSTEPTNRPIVWIDDSSYNYLYDAKHFHSYREAWINRPAFFVSTLWGLRPEHLNQVDKFLDSPVSNNFALYMGI